LRRSRGAGNVRGARRRAIPARRRRRWRTDGGGPEARPGGAVPAEGRHDRDRAERVRGYAGLIAANGGLAPSENSVFFKDHGFKVKITLSEEESWSALNSGKMAASATTADVLAVYGKQFQVVVPAQIGYSRGADGVVVRSDIKRINNLKGQVLATSQFTEADFLIRYLAQEAGLGLTMLADFKTTRTRTTSTSSTATTRSPRGLVPRRAEERPQPARRLRDVGAQDHGSRRGSGGKAHVLTTQQEPPDRRRHPDRQQRLRAGEPRRWSRAGRRVAQGQPDGARQPRRAPRTC
jgi:hypothetical protein